MSVQDLMCRNDPHGTLFVSFWVGVCLLLFWEYYLEDLARWRRTCQGRSLSGESYIYKTHKIQMYSFDMCIQINLHGSKILTPQWKTSRVSKKERLENNLSFRLCLSAALHGFLTAMGLDFSGWRLGRLLHDSSAVHTTCKLIWWPTYTAILVLTQVAQQAHALQIKLYKNTTLVPVCCK